jgi:plasmid stabilization system protein ParE
MNGSTVARPLKRTFHPHAIEQMFRTEEYFERVSVDLELKFREAINLELDFILESPEAAPVVHARGVRARLLRGFKFKIFYLIDEELGLVTILSVLHGSQDDELLEDLLD